MKVSQLLEVYHTTGPKHHSRSRTGPSSLATIKALIMPNGKKVLVPQTDGIILSGDEPSYSIVRQGKKAQ
jgi:hypothetical protein